MIQDDAPPGLDRGMVSSHLSQRIKTLRAQRGWSLEKLASICGVSRSMLSQIEREQATPTVMVALGIARGLGVSLDELVTPVGATSRLEILRGDEIQHVYRSDEHCRLRTLSPLDAGRRIEFYEITLAIGGALRSAPHFSGTRELLTVRQGTIRVEAGEETALLAAQDSIAYPADVDHALVNAGDEVAIAYLIDTYP